MENERLTPDEITQLISERKLSTLRLRLSDTQCADVAELFGELGEPYYTVLFRLLPKELAAETFALLDSDMQKTLIEAFTDRELREVLDQLYMDDTVDLVEEMPASLVRRIIANSNPSDRDEINRLLRYPKNSAGTVMTTEYVSFKLPMTVGEALDVIRRVAIDSETIYTCYVTDGNRHLLGIVTAKSLLLSAPETPIEDIMEDHVISIRTTEGREEAAMQFRKYDFLAMPVVDNENRLVGIITVDDAIDVIHEETEEDFARVSAILPTETPYLRTGIFSLFRSRIPWLLLLMLGATFTGTIISGFEGQFMAHTQLIVLTAFIPMLMDTGGNSGGQASITVIRGLSLGEVSFSDFFRVMWKECRVALLCGSTLAVCNFGKLLLVDRLLMNNPSVTWQVALVVSLTLLITVICAKLIGCILPLLARRVHLDPAVVASPVITTIVDAVSLLIYFTVAMQILL